MPPVDRPQSKYYANHNDLIAHQLIAKVRPRQGPRSNRDMPAKQRRPPRTACASARTGFGSRSAGFGREAATCRGLYGRLTD